MPILCYVDGPQFHDSNIASIFLAGPSPRNENQQSWRPQAIKALQKAYFNGVIYIPEMTNKASFDYNNQVEWEYTNLCNCTTIMFWVARKMPSFLGLTTNIEFGYWLAQGRHKVIYGRPDDADNIQYLDWIYKKQINDKPIYNDLDTLAKATVAKTLNQFQSRPKPLDLSNLL